MTFFRQCLYCVAIMVMNLTVQIKAQDGIPIDLLPLCDEYNEFGDLFTMDPGLSALKRAPKSYSYENRLLRRFSGPFSENIPLPWSCSMTPMWRDLGEEYFPRFVRDGMCNNSTCWYRHYECQPVLYSLKVLQRQHNECLDQNLPSTLSTEWRQRTLVVTSSCMCQRM